MSGQNLQRSEARQRGQLVHTQSYQVDLDLTLSNETFRSSTRVHFGATAGSSTFIDLIAPKVHSIVLNGIELDVATHFVDSRINLPDLKEDNTLEVIADCAYMNTGEGLHRFVDPVDSEVYLYSQFEVADSRRVFAVFEQPDLKAEFTFAVTAPAHWNVISNSPLAAEKQRVADTGNMNGVHDHGIATWTFTPTPRISSYITAIIAGPYRSVHDELVSSNGKTIPLGLYARASMFDYLDADELFDTTKRGFEFFEHHLGVPYPFEKYDQLFVPEFNAGAMENAGAVTFLEDYVFRGQVSRARRERRVITVLHELAHMWFGNLVTMTWWDDLWLNESFAEYMATLAAAEATEYTDAWVSFSALEKNWAYRQDQLPSTHPIVADMVDLDAVELNFDGITYAKGASVLTQLVTYVGRDNFFTGVQRYFARHAWANTTLDDFLSALEEASGRDLEHWAELWLQTSQVNTITAEVTPNEDGTRVQELAIVQSAPSEYPTLRPHRLAVSAYCLDSSGNASVTQTERWYCDVAGARTVIDAAAAIPQPDIFVLNDADHGYVKVHYPERDYAFITEHLSDFADPLTRSVLWSSAWDDTRSAELPASEFVDLVLRHIAAETHSGLLANLLRQLAGALDIYSSPDKRGQLYHRAAEKMLQLAKSTTGDQQLQYVRAFANFATGAHVTLLSGWFMDTDLPAGFSLDTDLRWHVLQNLARLGAVGEGEIADFAASDATASGQLHAAYARASLPLAEIKSEVWDELTGETQVANALQGELISGFNNVNDPRLLTEYGPKYFASVRDLWATRTSEMAQDLAHGLYPLGLVGYHDVIGPTEELLASLRDDEAGLRRILMEELDGARRAQAAQKRDE